MARKKKSAPSWAVQDNSFSHFGTIYDDLLASKQFQSLSLAARMMYITITVNGRTEKATECLYNALKERYSYTGDLNEFDLRTEVYSGEYFVFPKKQYERYGYTTKTAWKYLNELCENGFIEKVQCGKNQRKVNIYKFSTKWKQKPLEQE